MRVSLYQLLRRSVTPAPGLVVLAAVVVAATFPAHATERLTPTPIPKAAAWDYQLDAQQALWLLYYDDSKALNLRDPAGVVRRLNHGDAAAAPSGAELEALGESGVLALWRSKLPRKSLYLWRSDRPESEVLDVGGESEPSKRIVATRIGDRLPMLWVGEGEVSDSEADYQLFYSEVDLRTNTPDPIEHVAPGYYPEMAADDDGTVLAFSWVTEGDGARIVSRARLADASSFQPPVTIAEVPLITPIFRAFRSGERWVVIWLAQYTTDASGFQLEGAYSDDKGETWTRFAFDALKGYDVGRLDIAVDHAGHVMMAMSARQRVNTEERQDIVLLRSSDHGGHWSEPERLRADSVRGRFNAKNPAVMFGATPGHVVVVWEDWREIRSRLYASLSTDYGKSWSIQDVPLEHEPGVNLRLSPVLSALYEQDGRYHVIAEQAADDRLREKYLVSVAFSEEQLTASAPDKSEPPADERYEALTKRVDAFWKAMIAEEYAGAYPIYDPFFRSRISADALISKLGRLHYHSYEIEDTSIDGPLAQVKTKLRYSIGPFQMPMTGEVVSRPEQDVTIDDTWLWIDGEWYREFRSEVQEMDFTQY
jgi:hypothetical protein